MNATFGFIIQSPDAATGVAPGTVSTVDVSLADIGSLTADSGAGP